MERAPVGSEAAARRMPLPPAARRVERAARAAVPQVRVGSVARPPQVRAETQARAALPPAGARQVRMAQSVQVVFLERAEPKDFAVEGRIAGSVAQVGRALASAREAQAAHQVRVAGQARAAQEALLPRAVCQVPVAQQVLEAPKRESTVASPHARPSMSWTDPARSTRIVSPSPTLRTAVDNEDTLASAPRKRRDSPPTNPPVTPAIRRVDVQPKHP